MASEARRRIASRRRPFGSPWRPEGRRYSHGAKFAGHRVDRLVTLAYSSAAFWPTEGGSDEVFLLPPHVVAAPAGGLRGRPASVTCPNSFYDPSTGTGSTTATSTSSALPMSWASTASASTSITRTPMARCRSPNLMGVDPRAADQAGEDRRHRQRPAALQPAHARGRRIRHDRRDQRRPADRGDGRRRRAGVLQLHDQPDPRAGDVPRSAWTWSSGRGPSRGRSSSRRILEAQVRQPLAAAAAAAAPADLDSRRRQHGDDRVLRRAPLRATWAFRTSTCASSSGTSTFSARRAPRKGTSPIPSSSAGSSPIYVAETDEQAWDEYEQHLFYFAHQLLKGLVVAPPGYTSAKSVVAHPQARGDFLQHCQDAEGNRGRRLRHRRQPRHRAREAARAASRRYGVGNLLGAVPARHAAGRSDAQEHAALRARGDAVSAHALRRQGGRSLSDTSMSAATETVDVRRHRRHAAPQRARASRCSICTAPRPRRRVERGVRALGARYDVIVPGPSGVSGQRRPRPHPERRRPRAALRRSAERAAIQPPHVVGSSLGGWIAAELASLYPERVGSLVAGAAPPGCGSRARRSRRCSASCPDQLAERLFYDQQHPLAQMLHAAAETAFDTPPPEEILLAFHQSTEATARVAWNPYFHNPALERRLDRIAAPVLVLWGAEDRLIPRAHAERYRDRIRGAVLRTIPQCGHLPAIEKPDQFAREVLTFLDAHPVNPPEVA